MNKIKYVVLCILSALSLIACGGNISEVSTQRIESQLYSRDEIHSAVDIIKKSLRVIGRDALLQKFDMQEMKLPKNIRSGVKEITQMKLLSYFHHLMLIHLAEMEV